MWHVKYDGDASWRQACNWVVRTIMLAGQKSSSFAVCVWGAVRRRYGVDSFWINPALTTLRSPSITSYHQQKVRPTVLWLWRCPYVGPCRPFTGLKQSSSGMVRYLTCLRNMRPMVSMLAQWHTILALRIPLLFYLHKSSLIPNLWADNWKQSAFKGTRRNYWPKWPTCCIVLGINSAVLGACDKQQSVLWR